MCSGDGIDLERMILDPGLGFAKTWKDNLTILGNFDCFNLGITTLVGASRKNFIGRVTGQKVENRLAGTISTSIHLARHGADIIRVHDVSENRQALQMTQSICDFRNKLL